MKPHLRLYRSIWHCYVPGASQIVCGLGFTAVAAWIDWRILTNPQSDAAAASAATT